MKLMIKLFVIVLLSAGVARAQQAVPDPAHPGTFLMTIFLHHDETKTLGQINQHLKETG